MWQHTEVFEKPLPDLVQIFLRVLIAHIAWTDVKLNKINLILSPSPLVVKYRVVMNTVKKSILRLFPVIHMLSRADLVHVYDITFAFEPEFFAG